MYSMVLMAAMTTGMEVPDRHRGGVRRGGCGGTARACGSGGYGGCGVASSGCGSRRGGCGSRRGGCGGGPSYCSGGGYGYCGSGGMAYGGCGFGYPGMYGPGYPRGSEGLRPPRETRPEAYRPTESPATIVVHLPADATLTIEGSATRSASGTRTFISPPLSAGKSYTYTLEAKVPHRGETVTVRQDVVVRAGEKSEVRLAVPPVATAAR